jgi:NAD(P)-dependent dehydrogenase (short-subunit alcohol dehydrogenase family)
MFEKLDNLNGQVAVVAGGSGGIGFAIVKRLSSLGAKVIVLVRNDIELMQKRLDELKEGHLALLTDITDTKSLIDAANKLDQCDILINSAGYSTIIPHKNLEELTDELFDNIVKINFRSVFSTIRTFTPLLEKSNSAVIINISSTSAVRTGGSNMVYAASKAGVDSLTRNLSKALSPIRVISISPGSVNSGFLDLPKSFYDQVGASTPLKRSGTEEDIASAVEAVLTTMRFTTGNIIAVDGGKSL